MTSGTVSVRMLWPFMRVMRDFGPEMRTVEAAGLDPATLGDHTERVPRTLAREVIRAAIERTGDVALGVRAGERAEPADFGVTGQAVGACSDVRQAMFCMGRYGRLQDEDVETHFVEDGDRVEWQIRNVVPPVLDAANDFQVTLVVMALRQLLGPGEAPLEVHLQHARATNAAEYERVFRASVYLGAPHNAVVIRRSLLARPIRAANPHRFAIFDRTASNHLAGLSRSETLTQVVRRLVASRIGRTGISIEDICAQLDMSPSTLRRRLDESEVTYREIVDELRREMALHYLGQRGFAIGEIANMLDFSNQGSFSRSFRRWQGLSAVQYRQRVRVR